MNPELQRNLWLEASPRRLGWAALVLLLVYGGAAIVALQQEDHARYSVLDLLGMTGLVVLFGATLWSVRLAGQAVASEIGERTWEFQRLSALDPWSMTWGKLFGATSLAWAIGLTGLLLGTLGVSLRQGPAIALQFALTAVGAIILLQSAGMAAQLVGVRKARAEGRLASLRSAAGGMFSIVFLLGAAALISKLAPLWVGATLDPMYPGETLPEVIWWSMPVDRRAFACASVVGFAAWSLVGLWRLMRLELQMRNGPWVWTAFLLFAAVWCAGLGASSDATGEAATRWLAAVAPLAAAVYASAFAEPADRLRLQRFGLAVAGRRWSEASVLTPLLVPALLLCGAALGGLAIAAGPSAARPVFEGPLLALSIFAFIVRDLFVIAFFRFGPRPKRGDFGAVLALGLLYGLGGIVTTAAGGELTPLIFPNSERPELSLLSAAVQAALFGFLALRRIRQPERSTAAA